MKILLSAKNEDTGLALADFAVKRFSGKGHCFYVVHVIPPITSYVSFAAVPELIDEFVSRDRASGIEIVQSVAKRLKQRGVCAGEIEELVAEERPAEGILSAAEATGCDLILLHDSGASGLQQWLCGSVSAAVTTKSGCSVLLVNPVRKTSVDIESKSELKIPKHSTSMQLG